MSKSSTTGQPPSSPSQQKSEIPERNKHVIGKGGPPLKYAGRCSLYCGDTGCGKTCKAKDDCWSVISLTHQPCLVIDSLCVRNFDDIRDGYRVFGVVNVINRLYKEKTHALWVPNSSEELAAVCEQIKVAGDNKMPIILFIDEIAQWITAWHWPKELAILYRAHRHIGISIFTTTQYLKDVPPVFLHTIENCFAFKNTSTRAHQTLRETFGMDPEVIKTLQVGEYCEVIR